MITVALIEPETPGNIGAAARVMANFGYSDLILVSPKCDYLSEEARIRAKHGLGVLKKAKLKDWNWLKRQDTLVATTAQIGRDYNIPRSPISPEQLAENVHNATLVFGREGAGLSNEEIE